MHAEEGVSRVGHRVDHAAHEVLLGGGDAEVLPAERQDRRAALAVDERRHPVGLQPRRDHHVVEAQRGRVALDLHEDRVPLHQLFPLLVHTVLFGGGYAGQALAAARRALRS